MTSGLELGNSRMRPRAERIGKVKRARCVTFDTQPSRGSLGLPSADPSTATQTDAPMPPLGLGPVSRHFDHIGQLCRFETCRPSRVS